jgi:hypothetical protein
MFRPLLRPSSGRILWWEEIGCNTVIRVGGCWGDEISFTIVRWIKCYIRSPVGMFIVVLGRWVVRESGVCDAGLLGVALVPCRGCSSWVVFWGCVVA